MTVRELLKHWVYEDKSTPKVRVYTLTFDETDYPEEIIEAYGDKKVKYFISTSTNYLMIRVED